VQNTTQTRPETFLIWSDEIENGRIDVEYQRSYYKNAFIALTKSKFDIVNLGDIADIFQGVGKNETEDMGLTLLKVKNITTRGKIDYTETEFVKNVPQRKILGEGDIISPFIGEAVKLVKFAVFSNTKGKKFTVDNNIGVIRLAKDKAIPTYIAYYLMSDFGKKQIEQLIGGGGVPFLGSANAGKLKIILPPINIQKVITGIIEKGKEEINRLLEASQKILTSIDNFVLGELGIELEKEKEEITFEIENYDIEGRFDPFFYKPYLKRMAEQVKKQRNFLLGNAIDDMAGGATPKVTEDFYLDEGGVPFLRVQNITERGIDLSDVKFIKPEVHNTMLKRSQLKKSDLVFTITGRIGSVAVVPDNFYGNINQHSVRIHLKEKVNNTGILPEFIAAFFNTKIGRNLSFRYTTGGTRPALDYEALKSLTVPLPSVEKQKKIIAGVKTMYGKAKRLREEAENLITTTHEEVKNMIFPEKQSTFN